MHPVPLLFRQSLRTGVGLARTSRHRPPLIPSAPTKLSSPTKVPAREFAICLRCQFRAQSHLYSSREEEKSGKDEKLLNETNADANRPEGQTAASSAVVNEEKVERQHAPQSKLGGRDEDLPSEAEGRRSQLSKKFTDLMDNLQSNIFVAGQKLNDLTGYSAIEKLKRDIESHEARVREARSLVRQAKEAYSAAINRRSASQREVNELLQRKHAWSPADLERFTSLYRSDHANEVAEAEAQERLTAAEREVEEATAQLNRSILSRYHEEQIWSDKIRRMSTWGTWGLMGVNVLLFLIFQVLVEPWRRRRLVKGFEEKVKEAIENEAAATRAIAAGVAASTCPSTDAAVGSVAAAEQVETEPMVNEQADGVESNVGLVSDPDTGVPVTTLPDSLPPESILPDQLTVDNALSLEYWKATVHNLLSERNVVLTQRDLTTIAVQSAAAGAAVMGLLIAIFRPH
ncbi:hypothetical protein VTN77DRAFT_9050 [Rasamsonia byssochlamydoides]|uniref:uncharacterized protein n=1 Tax=Rasamsonia byssochlamydoides TaxID=89139 RepID=UPI003743FB36